MQDSKDDKDWQISGINMYRFCVTCIVIPSGLRSLVRFDEETEGFRHGRTLQRQSRHRPPSLCFLGNLDRRSLARP